ncbi:hypothetical protein N7447_001652 [Penicillium robsamsonii]|uniref:uncharacterized protein n=1 Tax=Penicillium robsamsonii TaxID=1792511 RepID=UPI0025476652|nr:uncharacterized protein N7447_001652 [Penicillium robsamsonii]KAJ5835626.1 hypothetical protein N7447_001652 [Penicillium robsamsonii]
MFPGGSQESFSPRRQPIPPKLSDSHSNVRSLSPLIQSVETPDFSQGILPGPDSHWPIQPIQSSISAVQGGQSTQAFALALPPHHPTTLDTNTSQSHALLGSNYLPTGSEPQSSIEDTVIKEEIGSEDSLGLGISSYPMSVVSDTYFAGPMQPNTHQYAWTSRPYQPLEPPPAQMNPPFPSSQPSYPSSSYPMGYHSQTNAPMHGYQQQEHQLPASYLAAPGNPPRHSQAQSPPIARHFHPRSASGTPPQPGQPLMTSPSAYMINQPSYYFPDTSSIPSHPASNSSQPPSMAPEPSYSSPELAAAADSDHPVRVLSLRPRPQCWDHGCNGREFSTFSNLLRHQREKSGVVAKAECPICGAVFTRTTARNIHVAQGKCKSSGRESSAE